LWLRIGLRIGKTGLGMVAHACNPSTQESEASLRPAWDKWSLEGQFGLQSKTLSEKQNKRIGECNGIIRLCKNLVKFSGLIIYKIICTLLQEYF
jgi:hypothetical protein